MASRYVEDTPAGKSISAFVILKNGKEIATVRAYYANGGTVLVNVFQHATDVITRCADVAQKNGNAKAKPEDFCFQYSRAWGWGYDKFTAALAGMIIDGHSMANHCGGVPEDEKKRAKLMRDYIKAENKDRAEWEKKANRIGATLANWDCEKNRYTSLHFMSGLERLSAFGYSVIQAI